METIHVRGQVGADGILRLELHLNIVNQAVEGVVVIAPSVSSVPRDANGYPLGFFEQLDRMAGAPLPERADQGALTARDALL